MKTVLFVWSRLRRVSKGFCILPVGVSCVLLIFYVLYCMWQAFFCPARTAVPDFADMSKLKSACFYVCSINYQAFGERAQTTGGPARA